MGHGPRPALAVERHRGCPEMNGRKIASHETDLAQEWIDIRDTIVKPALERLNEHLAGAP
jgi:hypothetical protein